MQEANKKINRTKTFVANTHEDFNEREMDWKDDRLVQLKKYQTLTGGGNKTGPSYR